MRRINLASYTDLYLRLIWMIACLRSGVDVQYGESLVVERSEQRDL